MKISYNWLKQYIDIPESPDDIGKVLTSTGLEVEHVEVFGEKKKAPSLDGLIVGHVLTSAKHPNADKLSITTVDIGGEKPLQIVCGAANVAAGQKVVVATPGVTLHPFNGEAFKIKLSKIRGEQSEGMLCAEDEIGLSDNHGGIIVLDANVKVGTPVSSLFEVPKSAEQTDYTIEIGLTPNRADAASHLGVARDIKAVLKRDIKLPSVDAFKTESKDLSIPVVVENKEACPRYSAVTITGITVGESPEWLKKRLMAIGLNPINNIVDITNFVLHELGQPMHAFDADKISGQKVLVKTLPAGTKFTTLDGKERSLAANDLMICDANSKPMCIGGVFGGADSGITAHTKNVFLESAYFSAAFVRKTGMVHQLKTDASFRFERGTDPNMTVYALKRAALLIKEIAGGKISSEIVDVYPDKIENTKFEVKIRNINRLIGKEIPAEEIIGILNRLDIETSNLQSPISNFEVSVPPYRVDVKQEADIVEEILRIYGLNNIELADEAGADFISGFPAKDINRFKQSVGTLLASNGFYEIMTNSLVNIKYKSMGELEPVEILNKLSEDQGIMRTTLLISGLDVCAFNINRKQKDLKLYEFGKIYWKENGKYREKERLALFITGQYEADNWQRQARNVSYHDLSRFIANVLAKSAINEVMIDEMTKDDTTFEYGVKIISNKKEIGRAGKVKSSIQKDFGIKQEIFYADLDVALLFNAANPKFDVQDVPKFPEVRRDLSLVLDRHVAYKEIEELVRNTERKLVKDIIVFDVYEGDKIPPGKKAYALGFTLQDEEKTLTDEVIDKTMSKLISAFETKMQALIRK